MNNRQNNKLEMYMAVHSVCELFKKRWVDLPAFVSAFNSFEQAMEYIKELQQVQNTGTAGATAEKQKSKEELIFSPVIVTGKQIGRAHV